MPILGGLFVTLFGGMATFFAGFMAKKAAFALAAVATFSALTAALIVAVQLAVAGLVVAFPETSPIVLALVWTVTPDVVPVAIAACITTDTAVAVYRWNSENLRLASMVS